MKKYIPHILLVIYVIEFIFMGISPYSRDVWYAENAPIVLIVVGLVVLYVRGIRFSNTAYILMSILPFLHTIGGHYTFERVPFEWFNNIFGFERNMFDRVAHFSVGFYAYALMEYVTTRARVATHFWGYLLSVACIMAIAATYELIEWVYAAQEGGSAGAAFLGSQGDIWDAQKDMLMDTLGGIFVLIIFAIQNFWQKQTLQK
jgi:putative membrane protein